MSITSSGVSAGKYCGPAGVSVQEPAVNECEDRALGGRTRDSELGGDIGFGERRAGRDDAVEHVLAQPLGERVYDGDGLQGFHAYVGYTDARHVAQTDELTCIRVYTRAWSWFIHQEESWQCPPSTHLNLSTPAAAAAAVEPEVDGQAVGLG